MPDSCPAPQSRLRTSRCRAAYPSVLQCTWPASSQPSHQSLFPRLQLSLAAMAPLVPPLSPLCSRAALPGTWLWGSPASPWAWRCSRRSRLATRQALFHYRCWGSMVVCRLTPCPGSGPGGAQGTDGGPPGKLRAQWGLLRTACSGHQAMLSIGSGGTCVVLQASVLPQPDKCQRRMAWCPNALHTLEPEPRTCVWLALGLQGVPLQA